MMLARWVAESLLAYAMRLRAINSEAKVFRQRYQLSKAAVLVIRALMCD
jgi:hypothetical protein